MLSCEGFYAANARSNTAFADYLEEANAPRRGSVDTATELALSTKADDTDLVVVLFADQCEWAILLCLL